MKVEYISEKWKLSKPSANQLWKKGTGTPFNVIGIDVEGHEGQIMLFSDDREQILSKAKLIVAAPEQQEASILLYNLLRKMATVVKKQDFDAIRPDWNRAMGAHEQAVKKASS